MRGNRYPPKRRRGLTARFGGPLPFSAKALSRQFDAWEERDVRERQRLLDAMRSADPAARAAAVEAFKRIWGCRVLVLDGAPVEAAL